MWHICGSHAGPGVPGTVPLMKGQGTWLSGTSQMPSASTHPGIPGASTVASELQSKQVRASVPSLPQCPLPHRPALDRGGWWIFLHTHS